MRFELRTVPVTLRTSVALSLLAALAGCSGRPETSAPEAQQADVASSSASAPLEAPNNTVDKTASDAIAPPAPIDERDILNDPNGQWAATASASSTYAQTNDLKAGYSPWQATGAPNVDRYSDSPLAWTTKLGDSNPPEWLEVGFANPAYATSIRVRQTAAPGAISKIELIDDANVSHTIWEGVDETPYAKDTIGWFIQDVPKTSYLVKGARITLQTARVWNWNEIDAMQLVGERPADQEASATNVE
jgi:hypothetical protein